MKKRTPDGISERTEGPGSQRNTAKTDRPEPAARKEPEEAPRRAASLKDPRVLTAAALLTAVSLSLAFGAKSLFGSGPIRVTIENLPIFLGGYLFGPVIGLLIAVAADLLSCLISGMAPNPIITAGAAAVGLISGLIFRYLPARVSLRLRVVLGVAAGHIAGSMLLKSIGLYPFYGIAVLWRIPLYLAIGALETLILILLLKNAAFRDQLRRLGGAS